MTVGLYRAPAPGSELGQLLLDAKFSVPRPRPAVVSRAGLVEAARSSGRRLVAVTAPAGYGKSTFLAQWAQAEDRRVAWVSLDRFDDDPTMLLVSLASAYCRAGLGRAGLIADMRGLGVSVLGRAAPLLASALRTSPVPFVLMLDDLHELRSPACHDVFGMLIAAIPWGLSWPRRAVRSSRTCPGCGPRARQWGSGPPIWLSTRPARARSSQTCRSA